MKFRKIFKGYFSLNDFHAWVACNGHYSFELCIQRNNYHNGNYGSSLTGKTSSVSLIFTQKTHGNVKTR